MSDFSTRSLVGAALMALGTLVLVTTATNMITGLDLILAVGALALTYGTYLVGTDVSGTPV